ncbi:MAG: hypothetical protein IJ158_05965 [Treponema sp.]|nr:hypothetical protein [Treponema sp.]
MQYLDKLKKERSIDRVIFLAGMVLAFIGFIIPTVYVRDELPSADEVAIEETTEEVSPAESEELVATSEDAELAENTELSEDLESSEEAVAEDDEVFDVLNASEEDDDLGFGDDEVPTKIYYKNIFGAAAYFNRSPVAYNATFIVAVWLCTIAGIALFFITKTIIGDIIATLIALAFGLASIVGIAPALSDEFGAYAGYYTAEVTPFFGYSTVGGYLVVIGLIAAVVGSILGAAHIQHPDQVASN